VAVSEPVSKTMSESRMRGGRSQALGASASCRRTWPNTSGVAWSVGKGGFVEWSVTSLWSHSALRQH
jgi:hypothetical protein